MSESEFKPFPKISRLASPVIITEKIDGSNGLIHVSPDTGLVTAGSRNRWLIPNPDGSWGTNDNYGFGQWVHSHDDFLINLLGPGYHYGEWFGKGIARGYELDHRRFYLFNVERYKPLFEVAYLAWGDKNLEDGTKIGVVPELRRAVEFDDLIYRLAISDLSDGSWVQGSGDATTSYPRPEGFVVFFEHNRTSFKVVLDKDNSKKSKVHDPNKPRKPQWTPEMIEAARKQREAEKMAEMELVNA